MRRDGCGLKCSKSLLRGRIASEGELTLCHNILGLQPMDSITPPDVLRENLLYELVFRLLVLF